MVDFTLSDEQRQIVAAFAELLADAPPFEALRSAAPRADSDGWVARLGKMGWIGIGLAESAGGAGLSVMDQALLMREAGRALLTPAFLASVLGAHAAETSAPESLPAILAGEQRVGLGIASGGRLLLFEAPPGAPVFVAGAEGSELVAADAVSERSPGRALDEALSLEQAVWRTNHDVTDQALHRRTVLLSAAQLVGLSEAARDMSVAYAKTREQFGQPIGAFQAIKHACADMAVRCEAALCQLIFAALSMHEARPDVDFQISAAKILSAEAALSNAEQNIQVHGGMGFSAESGAHLYLKRAHLMNLVGGAQRRHAAAILELAPAA